MLLSRSFNTADICYKKNDPGFTSGDLSGDPAVTPVTPLAILVREFLPRHTTIFLPTSLLKCRCICSLMMGYNLRKATVNSRDCRV